MFIHQTDAHSHFNLAEELDYSGLFGINICVSACFADEWKLLYDFEKLDVKKSYGVYPSLQKSCCDKTPLNEDELFASYIPALQEFLIDADAIGEIGLDKRFEGDVSISLQEKIFSTQLELADKYNLPVVIHCVGKWGMLHDILKTWTSCGNAKRFLIHSANCSTDIAEKFVDMGGFFSFGMRELISEKASQCAKAIPLDRILIESDSLPTREILDNTLLKLAEIRNENPVDLSENIYANFLEFYKNE